MYLLGFLTRLGDARSVWIGIAATIVFTGWTVVAKHAPDTLPSWARVPFDLYYTGIIGNVVFLLVTTLVALATGKRHQPKV